MLSENKCGKYVIYLFLVYFFVDLESFLMLCDQPRVPSPEHCGCDTDLCEIDDFDGVSYLAFA